MSRRLTIFAKGNLDLRDSLLACHENGVLAWNGLNEVMPGGWRAHVRHETFTRSDALLAAAAPPPGLAEADPPLGPYPLAAQFGTALFDRAYDAVILSIQPDLMTVLARHRSDGYLFFPHDHRHWPAEQARWLAENFTASEPLEVDRSMANLAAIVDRLRARSAVPILIYNVSAAVPGEWIHDHSGLAETLATRIRRFNLGLVDLSRQSGVSIVDVDALVAQEGARRMTLDPLHLTAFGCRPVAQAVVRILDDLGCFAGSPCG